MLPLSDAELAAIRKDADAAVLDQVCIIERKTTTPDGIGSSTETWSILSTVMAGISQPSGGQLANYDYLIGSLATWQVRLPYGTDVTHQDRLLLGGQTLIVQVILAPRSYAALLTVLASEVK